MADAPETSAYVVEMLEMLRLRDPAAYRAFLVRWRNLHQRGAADRLLAMDDSALRVRIERMILDNPALSDLHESARQYLEEHGGGTVASPPSGREQAAPSAGPNMRSRRLAMGQSKTLRLRRRPRPRPAGERSSD